MERLQDIQRATGANFGEWRGRLVALDYGNPEEEYRAVRRSMGLLDRSAQGKLVITGNDRLSWLQGMVSNDVRLLAGGALAIPACILNATGHLLADLRIINRGDSLLLDMEPENLEKIFRLLEEYIITEDVEIVDQTDALACLSLQGPHVNEQHLRAFCGNSAHVIPADHTDEGGVDIYLRTEDAPKLWREFLALGAHPVGAKAAEILRVEAGIPLYGVDMDENTLPLEANLEATHISHTKGCYVGQEVIARIHSRGHTNRALTGLLLERDPLPEHGDRVYPATEKTHREVGWVTSAVYSPALQRGIALGYVRHEYRAPGTPLQIASAAGLLFAKTAELPFYRAHIHKS
jgi:folate-binding protein YgfZ